MKPRINKKLTAQNQRAIAWQAAQPRKQQVWGPSRTQSGTPGFFTGNTIVLHIDEELFATFQRDQQAARKYVERCFGAEYFEFTEEPK